MGCCAFDGPATAKIIVAGVLSSNSAIASPSVHFVNKLNVSGIAALCRDGKSAQPVQSAAQSG